MSEDNQTQLEKPRVASQAEMKAADLLKVDDEMQVMPSNFSELYRYATVLSRSDLVPKDYKGKPDNVVVAIQYGAEIGLKPLQAMQGIAVINGRPTLWGDHMLAVIRASGAMEYMNETDDGKTATCEVKRTGEVNPIVRTFSMDDAKTAGLLGKQGPWTNYPKRMRQMRARAFACRDAFADILKGFQFREEVEDFESTQQPTIVESKESLMPKRISKPVAMTEDEFLSHQEIDHEEIAHDIKANDISFEKISVEQCEALKKAIVEKRRRTENFYEFVESVCNVKRMEDILKTDFDKVMSWVVTN